MMRVCVGAGMHAAALQGVAHVSAFAAVKDSNCDFQRGATGTSSIGLMGYVFTIGTMKIWRSFPRRYMSLFYLS